MAEETSTYLKKLKFDSSLLSRPIAGYLSNIRITLLIVLSIIIYGIYAYATLPRRINPEVKIPIVFISAILPGANPADIEQLVTVKIENAVRGLAGISEISSSSLENISTTYIQFESDIDPDKARNDVQAAVDTITDLPSDAQTPKVTALDFEDVPVWTFALTSNTDLPALMDFSKNLKDELEDLPSVEKVIIAGLENKEIQVIVNEQKTQEYRINPPQLASAINESLNSFPAGIIRANGTTINLTIDPKITTIDDLRRLLITVDSQTIKLSELADIYEKSIPYQPKTYYSNGQNIQRAVNFSVFKTRGADADKAAADSKKRAEELVNTIKDRFAIISILDFDKEINDQFSDLLSDFSQSLFLVFLVLLIFLGLRQAAIASITIPISFFFTFAVMKIFNITLSFISIFSLLLGLGMIVDDTIVMISAMTSYYKTKKFTPLQTGLLVWRDFISPTLSSNLTNIWSFLPLLIATGIIGQFIRVLPIVVTIALVGSTAIALLVTLPFMIVILNPQLPKRVINLSKITFILLTVVIIFTVFKGNPFVLLITITFLFLLLLTYNFRNSISQKFKSKVTNSKQLTISKNLFSRISEKGLFDARKPIQKYEQILEKVISQKTYRRKTLIIVIAFSLFSYILVPLGLVKNEFFPKTDQGTVYISLELPQATSLDVTNNEALSLISEITKEPHVQYVISEIGGQVNAGSVVTQRQTNRVLFSVKLTPIEERQVSSMQISQNLRERFSNYQKGDLIVEEPSSGPPAGSDLQITYLGDDLGKLENYADKTIAYLKSIEGTTNIRKSITPGTSQLTFVPDEKRLKDSNITVGQIGLWLRTFTSGFTLDSLKVDDEDTNIIFRFSGNISSPESIGSLSIPTQQGAIPLLSLGEFKLQPNPTLITRKDGKRSITVSSAVLPGFNIPQLGSQLTQYAQNNLGLENGYTWETGGINEENQKSVQSILQAMLIAAILILITLVVELNSFRKAIIVMLVIPLAVSGVFILFSLFGIPLSFPALIGILSLFGIVIKNSIMIVDKINTNLSVGLPFKEAIVDGAGSRLEPIIFSSITNIVGLIPITISDPLWRGLGGAIISGLTFSGTITLFIIPVIYYLWFNKEYDN
jgi:multidrug efflux pump